MREYRILFDYRPGTKTQVPEHVFVELEDETGRSTGAGAWEGHPAPKVKKSSYVYLVLPAPDPAIQKALEDARAAIASLDVDALGRGEEVTGGDHPYISTWSLRDELLDKINKALNPKEET